MSRHRGTAIVLVSLVAVAGGVTRARGADAWAAAVENLAAQIEQLTPQGRQVTLAVLDFVDQAGASNEFGRLAAARLTLVLGRDSRLLAIERRGLTAYLNQYDLRRADLLNPETARRFARDVGGLELLVVTGLAELGDQVSLAARVIDIASNRPLGVASVLVPKDAKVRRFLEAGRDAPGETR